MVDGGHRPIDAAQQTLCAAVVAQQRAAYAALPAWSHLTVNYPPQ